MNDDKLEELLSHYTVGGAATRPLSVQYSDDTVVTRNVKILYIDQVKALVDLVIQECARIAKATPCAFAKPISDQVAHAWDMACIESGKAIENNFGVK